MCYIPGLGLLVIPSRSERELRWFDSNPWNLSECRRDYINLLLKKNLFIPCPAIFIMEPNMVEIKFGLGSSIATWQAVARALQDAGFEPSFNDDSFTCNVTEEFANKLRAALAGWGF